MRRRRSVLLRLELADDLARLIVADDGRGMDPAELAGKLAQGHIGLDSQRVRIEAAGGTLRIGGPSPLVDSVSGSAAIRGTGPSTNTGTGMGQGSGPGTGTTVTVVVPAGDRRGGASDPQPGAA